VRTTLFPYISLIAYQNNYFPMTSLKPLTIWTIVLNFFIIIGAGHGIACIGLLEIMYPIVLMTGHHINDDFLSWSLTASYEKSFGATTLFSLCGQLILILSFYMKGQKQFWIKLSGLCFLWVGFYYLAHNLIDDGVSELSFFVGIPFLVASGLLAYRMTWQYKISD
jgi:hypothetical protein